MTLSLKTAEPVPGEDRIVRSSMAWSYCCRSRREAYS